MPIKLTNILLDLLKIIIYLTIFVRPLIFAALTVLNFIKHRKKQAVIFLIVTVAALLISYVLCLLLGVLSIFSVIAIASLNID